MFSLPIEELFTPPWSTTCHKKLPDWSNSPASSTLEK